MFVLSVKKCTKMLSFMDINTGLNQKKRNEKMRYDRIRIPEFQVTVNRNYYSFAIIPSSWNHIS
jgi:hypothetical protein